MKEIVGSEGFNMLKRAITGIGLILVLTIAFILGPKYLEVLIQAIIVLAGYEIYLIKKGAWSLKVLLLTTGLLLIATFIQPAYLVPFISLSLFVYAFYAIISLSFTLEDAMLVFFLTSILTLAILSVKKVIAIDLNIFIYILIATFATDTFAYLGGNMFGKHKLIERISPNKTVEGAIIGFIFSVILSLLYARFYVNLDFNIILLTSLSIPIVSQIGDLTFSMIKRTYKIKDFGYILPGHGGILDRIDSILFSLLVFNAIITVMG